MNLLQQAETHLHHYRLLSRRLMACRDRFGLDLTPSVIEEPLLGLALAQEINRPFGFLEKFDAAVHEAILAARPKAFEFWHLPALGAAVLGRTKRLAHLPRHIHSACRQLLQARQKIRTLNGQLIAFEREMELGDDRHFRELNRLKITLQKALQAFGAETEFREELEAFPLTERVWWLPKLLTSTIGAMKSPDQAVAGLTAMPWLRRQSYLRYVPGLTTAASYVKKVRAPVLRHLMENFLGLPWERALVQSGTIGWALDLTERCAGLRKLQAICTKVLDTLQDDAGRETSLKEDLFWGPHGVQRRVQKALPAGPDGLSPEVRYLRFYRRCLTGCEPV